MICPPFSSTLNCSLALKSFMKRDKTWRIGRSSKKWSAMNFRASAWSNRNLVTCRKICNSIPSFWGKIKESKKTEGIYFKQMCRIEMLSQSRLKRRRKVSIKGQCRLSSRLSVSKKDRGLLLGVGLSLDYYEERTTEEGEWLGWLSHKKPATLLLTAPLSEQLHVLQGITTFESCRKGSSRWIIESD